MYQNAYAPYGYVPYGGRFGFNNSGNQPYANNGQFGYGQQGVNPQGQLQPNNNADNYDPNSYQQTWQNPPQNNQPIQGSGKRHQKAPPEQTTAFNPSPATPSEQPATIESIPPIAPDREKKSSPFADGFIQVIMTKFDGDVGEALKDKEMYSWAQALNLVDRKKTHHITLSASRKETIDAVLKDESLDSRAKLETLKILLK